jgi:acetyl-CoA acetyltransferase family protein
MSKRMAKKLKIKPLARIVAMAVAGCGPDVMGEGPIFAVPKALTRAGMRLKDIDIIELNEAFASQSLAVIKGLGLDEGKVNVHGGAIALGHPLGATGARIMATLVNALERYDKGTGLETMCVGGGQAVAAIIERL